MSNPVLLMSGRAAMDAVARILPTAYPVTVQSNLGPVLLRPGSVWSGNKMLVDASPMVVHYTIDDRLYEWGAGDFLRGEWLDALGRGAATAHWLVTLGQVEFALLCGIFAPWYLMLGMACAKVVIFYGANKPNVDRAFQEAPRVVQLLQEMRRRYPTLWNRFVRQVVRETWDNLPAGVTAEDVAFLVGRLIRGGVEAPEAALGPILRMAAKVTLMVAAIHLPGIAAHALEQAAAQRAAELRRNLQEAGYTVTDGEARTILRELLSHRDSADFFQRLQTACQALLPSLNALARSYTGAP
jgi:hypothetical protein